VVGDQATYVMRSILPDVPTERLYDLATDAAAPFTNISLLPPSAVGDAEISRSTMMLCFGW
jgi:inositol-1,3,4-trisphosphate 5/6-kinase/inositol-tetrakisphosphate 1-kinase